MPQQLNYRRRCSLPPFGRGGSCAMALLAALAIFSTALLPLVHRHGSHASAESRDSAITAAVLECASAGVADADQPEQPASPDPDDSSCPICLLIHTGKNRVALDQPAAAIILAGDLRVRAWPPGDSRRDSQTNGRSTSPRGPPQLIV